MTPIRRGLTGGLGNIVIATACIFAAMAAPSPAHAQQVILIVNGEIITNYDIEQRSKFDSLSNPHKAPARAGVIEELIDDKLKAQNARRYKIDITDKDVDSQYADMAKRMHLTADLLTQTLTHSGIDPKTLKARILADLSWQYIIRGRFQAELQVPEKSVTDAIETNKKGDGGNVGYDYTLRPILFVVPHGNTAIQEARRKDADALRARFADCNSGLPFARSLRDVAIREPITKNSSDLEPALRQILDKTELGHLTPPETTTQGVELFALCEKKETKAETPEKREAREKIFSEKFQAKSKWYLRELRRQAMIERKQQ